MTKITDGDFFQKGIVSRLDDIVTFFDGSKVVSIKRDEVRLDDYIIIMSQVSFNAETLMILNTKEGIKSFDHSQMNLTKYRVAHFIIRFSKYYLFKERVSYFKRLCQSISDYLLSQKRDELFVQIRHYQNLYQSAIESAMVNYLNSNLSFDEWIKLDDNIRKISHILNDQVEMNSSNYLIKKLIRFIDELFKTEELIYNACTFTDIRTMNVKMFANEQIPHIIGIMNAEEISFSNRYVQLRSTEDDRFVLKGSNYFSHESTNFDSIRLFETIDLKMKAEKLRREEEHANSTAEAAEASNSQEQGAKSVEAGLVEGDTDDTEDENDKFPTTLGMKGKRDRELWRMRHRERKLARSNQKGKSIVGQSTTISPPRFDLKDIRQDDIDETTFSRLIYKVRNLIDLDIITNDQIKSLDVADRAGSKNYQNRRLVRSELKHDDIIISLCDSERSVRYVFTIDKRQNSPVFILINDSRWNRRC